MELGFLLVGYLLGCIVTMLIFRKFIVGVLRVDRSDPDDQPYMFLELSKSTDAVTSKKYVILKVHDENYISQR